jgi:hypothetical protein
MVTNLDLIWQYVKSLANKLMSSDENMMNEELFEQYELAFGQLVQIIEDPSTEISEEKLEDIRYTLGELERTFAEYQSRIQDTIVQNRLKSKVINFYSHPGARADGFSKKS